MAGGEGLKANLEGLGFAVTGLAVSGAEALEMAAAARPDLVLMDVLPKGDMDGIKVAEHLRSLEIPVVFLTAYADTRTLGRAKVVEPFGYILKPFEVQELRSAIEIALYKSQAEKRLQHLNLVLRAIRSIGQLIIQEKDRDRLIQGACQLLTEGRGYFAAWIALLDGDSQVAATAKAGSYHASSTLPGLEQGNIPPCVHQALEQGGLLVVEELATGCGLSGSLFGTSPR